MWPLPSIILSTFCQILVYGHEVLGGEYMTISRSLAIVNVTYHNPATDSMYTEVR